MMKSPILMQNLLLALVIAGTIIANPVQAKQAPLPIGPSPIAMPPIVPTTCPAPIGQPWIRTELFFGLSKADGSMIKPKEFQAFLDREVTPRFPDGLTLLTGLGQFKNATGKIIQERSQLLILLYAFDTIDGSKKVEQIRQSYKTAFKQESVLRVDSVACVSF
jgi:Protein of unknown function (DUF3574)